MPVPQLTDAECDALLTAHPEWSIAREGLAIERKFQFANFSEATWVGFKTFANLPITFVFMACQVPLLKRGAL